LIGNFAFEKKIEILVKISKYLFFLEGQNILPKIV